MLVGVEAAELTATSSSPPAAHRVPRTTSPDTAFCSQMVVTVSPVPTGRPQYQQARPMKKPIHERSGKIPSAQVSIETGQLHSFVKHFIQ